jgi:flagellar basal-body rod protein FlgF
MDSTSYVGLSHMTALRREMDMVANNIANMSTNGYKSEKPLFTWFLNKAKNDVISRDKVAYVEDFGQVRNLEAGVMTPTGNPLDIAINSEGYFSIQTPQGVQYTRAGNFNLNADNQIVTRDGKALLDDKGSPIQIPPGTATITISNDGTLTADAVPVARIVPVVFENERELEKLPDGLYKTEQTPQPGTRFELRQGMIEGSNVQAVVEMTHMIDISRAYETAKRFVDREDDRMRDAIKKLAGNQS